MKNKTIALLLLLSCTAVLAKPPALPAGIRMAGDLDASGHSITNAADFVATNGNSLARAVQPGDSPVFGNSVTVSNAVYLSDTNGKTAQLKFVGETVVVDSATYPLVLDGQGGLALNTHGFGSTLDGYDFTNPDGEIYAARMTPSLNAVYAPLLSTSNDLAQAQATADAAIKTNEVGTMAYENAGDYATVITNEYTITAPTNGALRTFNPNLHDLKVRCRPTWCGNNQGIYAAGYAVLSTNVAIAGNTFFQLPWMYPHTGSFARMAFDSSINAPDYFELVIGPETNSWSTNSGIYGCQTLFYRTGFFPATGNFAASLLVTTNISFTSLAPQTIIIKSNHTDLRGNGALLYSQRDGAGPFSTAPRYYVYGVYACKTNYTAAVLSTFLKDANGESF